MLAHELLAHELRNPGNNAVADILTNNPETKIHRDEFIDGEAPRVTALLVIGPDFPLTGHSIPIPPKRVLYQESPTSVQRNTMVGITNDSKNWERSSPAASLLAQLNLRWSRVCSIGP